MGKYSTKELEQLSGIKAHTIRIWEKRYSITTPSRTDTNIRLYSDADLRKIINVSLLYSRGLKISRIAAMSDAEITQKVLEITESQTDNPVHESELALAMINNRNKWHEFLNDTGEMKKTIVIGSGLAGLSAAAGLAREGFDVTVFEKNGTPGGRARKFESEGFVFDMGPSWYWMPDVFEKFFQQFGRNPSDYYQLKRLDPSYRVYYGADDYLDVPSGVPALTAFFESLEPGSGKALKAFLEEGAFKYGLGMHNLVYKPGLTWREFADRNIVSSLFRLHIFQSLSKYVRKFFRHPRLIGILEFPVLFLGAAPSRTPALYSLMNYADMSLGTWYPIGGMFKVVEAMMLLCEERGVKFRFNAPVSKIVIEDRSVQGIISHEKFYSADYLIAGADYHHVETDLLPPSEQQYSRAYWKSRIMAPSCLIFYLGVNKEVKNLLHHTLFFDESIDQHIQDIYEDPKWPAAPQFYVCCPSKTDPLVAPRGHENIFVLIPTAPGLKDDPAIREKYFDLVIMRMEHVLGESIRSHIIFKKSYGHEDFASDYNAFKGNAYGLANTLRQTANLKPRVRHRNVKNLFYTGQLTVPGPGVPPALISGQVATATVLETHKNQERKLNVR